MFIDRVQCECNAGKGGNGVVAWRREKYIPKGGPAGGGGGHGGSIIFQADHNEFTLDAYEGRSIIRAPNGNSGGSGCKKGRYGEDLILKVPCGTVMKDSKTGELIYDFTTHGETFKLCQGGRGGRGNASFRSSTNRAPNISTPGADGEVRKVDLELKLIADVGFVGMPNAGKSTLLNKLTNVSVKTAAYPFTTLRPNLGFMIDQEDRILLADIPGIIKGAHNNKGLGFEFLRHIVRTKVLIFVIDASGIEGRSPIDDFIVLRDELQKYDPELIKRQFLIALNKCDVEESSSNIELFLENFPEYKSRIVTLSAERGDNCSRIKLGIRTLVKNT